MPLVGAEFTFPDGDGVPPHSGEFVLHFQVTCFVASHLVLPEGGVGLGHLVVGTSFVSVPEAAVDEDAGAVASEHDVGFAWQAGIVQTITETIPPLSGSSDSTGGVDSFTHTLFSFL